MTTKSLIAVAAALVAGVTLLTPTAEAGGGIRLGFGGPLGSFVARPTQGYYSPSYSSRSYSHRSYGSPSCDKPKSRSAHSYDSRPAPKKHVSVASKKHHDDDEDDDKSAKAKKKAEQTKTAEKSDKNETIKQVATNSIPLEATAATQPAASVAPDLKAAAKIENTAVTAPAAIAAPKVESAALVPATAPIVESKPETKVETKPAGKTAKTTDKAEKKSDCRRFIPAAGITVTVRCND
ncbi:MAG: hypothetical protein ABL908_06370 [Hyphomicrobium sp.]